MHETLIVSNKKKLLIIWFNPKKHSYYYRYVSGFYQDYYVGYKNQYDHTIILIIELVHSYSKTPLKKRLLRRLIVFLENIERR